MHRLGNIHTIRVVTSDYLEKTMVLSNGGIRRSSGELREERDAAARNRCGGQEYETGAISQ